MPFRLCEHCGEVVRIGDTCKCKVDIITQQLAQKGARIQIERQKSKGKKKIDKELAKRRPYKGQKTPTSELCKKFMGTPKFIEKTDNNRWL
jgi:hypothetical protein